jgi:hypothetical protein
MIYRGIKMIAWGGKKIQFKVQLLQQVLENTKLARECGLQNAFIFMPIKSICVSE